MMTFYRRNDCPACEQVEQILDELVLAHDVEVVASARELPESAPRSARLPLLHDGEEWVAGHEAITAHLENLADFKALWDKFQTDACYCDEHGNVE